MCSNVYIPGQNIWNKIEKSSEIGQGKNAFISTYAYSVTAITKVLFLEGKLGSRVSLM